MSTSNLSTNNLTTAASTTPSTAPVVNAASHSAAGNAAGTKPAAAAVENTTADFVALLTQLLGAAEASAVATTGTVTSASTGIAEDKKATDDATLAASAAALASAGVPWELLLASAAASEHRASIPSALDSGKDVAALLAGTPQLQAQLQGKLQGMQLARDVQTLLGNSASADGEAQPTQTREASGSDGFALANAMSAAAFNAQQLAPEGDHSTVRAHVGAPAWADELGGKLTWLTARGIQSASLVLTPEHLGPMEIRISINNDQASVWFGAAHADTRIALEQALPRLREMFAAQGLNLADTGVFREPPREQAKNYFVANDVSHSGSEQEIRITALRARGIVDAYA